MDNNSFGFGTPKNLSTIPNMPIAMLAEGNNDFVCMASIIGRPSGTPINGQPITWEILANNSDHGSSLIRSVLGDTSTQFLKFRYPTVKKVLSFLVTGDESFATQGVLFGSSVGTNVAQTKGSRVTESGFKMQGNGTSWSITPSSAGASLTINAFSAGLTSFNIASNIVNFDSNKVQISYVGEGNYRVKRKWSGIAGTAGVAFYLVDNVTNTVLTTAPTSTDYIIISSCGVNQQTLPLGTWGNPANPQNTNIFMAGGQFNFWCIGMFELWLKCMPLSTTSILAKWQAKTGVTSYILKRSTAFTVDVNGDYVLTTPVTIYTGTDLEFVDTGLTGNTMYYYQLLNQSSVEISQFNTKTR